MKQMRNAFFLTILLPLLLSAQTAFRFAWLSDTHIGSSGAAEDLARAVEEINAADSLQFVILSGDITESGTTGQLRQAHDILANLRREYYIIPGNHDTKWSESGTTAFPQIFGNDRFVFDYGRYLFIGLHQGPRMRMADGHWAPEDVDWLKSVLKRMKNPRKRIIFVTHYPLDDGIANWYVVLDLLKKHNTQVCLVGHGHGNHKQNYEGIPGVMSRSNLRAKDSVGGFTIATVSGDSIWFAEKKHGQNSGKPWHVAAMGERNFAADTSHPVRPSFAVNEQFPHVREVWRQSTHFTIGSSPAIAGDKVIVGDASGTVAAYSLANGRKQWQLRTKGPVYSTPDIAGKRGVVASTDGTIYCFNTATGNIVWTVETKHPIVGCPLIDHGRVFIGGSDGTFRCLDLLKGAEVWHYDSLKGFVEARPVLADGKVMVGAWDEHFYAFDAKSGRLEWTWTGNKRGSLLSPAACWPVAANGTVFIVAPDRKMTAVDIATGRQLWRTGRHEVRETIGRSTDGSLLFVRTMRDSLIALPASRDLPEPAWTLAAGFGYDINSAAIVEKNGTLFYGAMNGLLIAVDARTGAVKWKHRVGVGLLNTVAPLDANRVVVTDFDGTIALIQSDKR